MTQQTYSANDVLMGGGGAPAAKFANPGDTLEGAIAAPPGVYQERDYDPNTPGGGKPKTFPSGDPIMAVYVDVQTTHRDPSISEDDGVRRFYVEGRHLKSDVRDAIRRAGANGLEVGGRLKVTFTHREDPMDKRSRKFWDVTYTPVGNAALMGDNPAPATQAVPPTPPAAPATPAPQAAPAAPTGPTAQDIATAKTLIAAGLDDGVIRTSAPTVSSEVLAALRNAATAA
jgi:hypothetical protein